MESIKKTPIEEKKKFIRDGYVTEFVKKENGLYLYRLDDGSYEVVKGVKYKQPDGSVVDVYPCSSMWGTHGLTFSSLELAEKCMKLGFEEYKKWKEYRRKNK